MEVEYRIIEGYPLYRVGNDGSAWTKAPYGRSKTVSKEWRRLKGSTNRSGHIVISLGGRYHRQYLHVLVAQAFLGPQPEGMLVRHLDDNPGNNCLLNIAYGTPRDNYDDSVRNGTAYLIAGECSPWSKLDAAEVLQIVELVNSGLSKSEVGRRFRMHTTSISAIMTGQAWSSVTGIVYNPTPNGRKGQKRQKLSDSDIQTAFELKAEGWKIQEIADEFGVAYSTMRHTLSGQGRKISQILAPKPSDIANVS